MIFSKLKKSNMLDLKSLIPIIYLKENLCLRHIVMWKFNECVDKQIIGKEIKSSLLNLCKSMDEVIMADIVYNVLPTSTHGYYFDIGCKG